MSRVWLADNELGNEILLGMSEIAKEIQFRDVKLGLAGSIVRGNYNDKSDIDIVVDNRTLNLNEMQYMKGYFNKRFGRDVDIISIPLLREEDLELDAMCRENNMTVDEYSVYKNIEREVVWVE